MTLENPQANGITMTDDMIGTTGLAQDEIARLESYEKIYALTHPFPKKPEKISFWQMMALEAGAFYIAAIGGVVLAAIRTGGLFMATEQLILSKLVTTSNFLVQVLPIMTLISSLFAFEGYLFAVGLRKGRESGRLNTSVWGTGAAFVVSILAGWVSSLPIVDINTSAGVGLGLYWLLAFAMGAGATILAYLGAENVGVLHNVHESKVAIITEKWQGETKTWYEFMQRDYRNRGRSKIFGMDSFKEEKAAPAEKQHVANVQASVRQYLKERGLSAWDIGTTSQGKTVSPKAVCEELSLLTPQEQSNVRVVLGRLRDEEQRNQAQ